jgi:CheY-like chemotaxis protein
MATFDLKALRFLLVDPDRFYRAILREQLRSLRCWDVHEAPSLEAARPLLDPDLDVLITEWPGADTPGARVLRQIRTGETAADPMIPIVVVMADTSKRNVLLARDAGANELLAKPVLMRRLFERLMHATLAPQPFVKTSLYVGPDRRRFTCSEYHGLNRRAQQEARREPADSVLAAPTSLHEWPTGEPFVPATPKLFDIRTRADRPGISMAEADVGAQRALRDLEDHHSLRLLRAIKRLKRAVTDPDTINSAEKLGRELRPPALDIATTAPMFNFSLAGDIAWMLKTLVETLPLEEQPVLTMARRLIETLRVTIDACVYDSCSTEGERILKELQTTNKRLVKRFKSPPPGSPDAEGGTTPPEPAEEAAASETAPAQQEAASPATSSEPLPAAPPPAPAGDGATAPA